MANIIQETGNAVILSLDLGGSDENATTTIAVVEYHNYEMAMKIANIINFLSKYFSKNMDGNAEYTITPELIRNMGVLDTQINKSKSSQMMNVSVNAEDFETTADFIETTIGEVGHIDGMVQLSLEVIETYSISNLKVNQ